MAAIDVFACFTSRQAFRGRAKKQCNHELCTMLDAVRYLCEDLPQLIFSGTCASPSEPRLHPCTQFYHIPHCNITIITLRFVRVIQNRNA